jgi:cytochrome c biogenesis protein CcmG/thiol:disulfide interchange protein DsbE
MKLLIQALFVVVLTCGVVVPRSVAGGKPAPNFAFKTADGNTVELKNLAGKVVLVNFWATWCGPCRAEIPGMLEVYKKYKAKGLEIVGVSLDSQGWAVVKPFIEKLKIDYPVVVGDPQVVSDYGNFQGIPTTFVVDRKGNIVVEHTGAVSKGYLEQMIKPFL